MLSAADRTPIDPTAPVEAHLADVTLRVLFLTSVPLLCLSLLRVAETGWLPVMGVHIVIVALLGVGTALRARLSTAMKGALLIGFFLVVGAGTILTNDAYIYGSPFFFVVLLFAAIFFPLRTTAALMLVTLALQGAHQWWSRGAMSLHDALVLLAISTLSLTAVYALTALKAALATAVASLGEQNERLIEAREEALAASQAKSDFLANMSHELRTPMSAILGVADLLREHPLDAEDSEYVEMIRSSGDILLTLLNDILDLSKIEASKLEIEEVPMSVAQLVDDVAAMMRVRAERKGLRLEVELPAELPTVAADPTRLRQLLINLLGNALKFTERGEVVLRVEVRERSADTLALRFAVRDSGIGIAAEKIPHLFHAFHQVDSSTTRRFGGTGLGLAICKQLVTMMRGDLGVRSELGVGSEFWFRLPLRLTDQPVETRAVNEAASAPINTNARVLLAEDNPVLQLIAKTLLEKIGLHDITVAGDGREALELLAERDFEVVLMDIQMPELDGLEAVRRLRAGGPRNREVPVIALTASAMKGYDQVCRAAGMSDYLSKPISLDRLRATLSAWIPAPRPAPRAYRPTTAPRLSPAIAT
ncbi:MAG: ATP-binding protein [Nannocystaceae bacterium]